MAIANGLERSFVPNLSAWSRSMAVVRPLSRTDMSHDPALTMSFLQPAT